MEQGRTELAVTFVKKLELPPNWYRRARLALLEVVKDSNQKVKFRQ